MATVEDPEFADVIGCKMEECQHIGKNEENVKTDLPDTYNLNKKVTWGIEKQASESR